MLRAKTQEEGHLLHARGLELVVQGVVRAKA